MFTGLRQVDTNQNGLVAIPCPECGQSLYDCTTECDIQRRFVCIWCKLGFVFDPPISSAHGAPGEDAVATWKALIERSSRRVGTTCLQTVNVMPQPSTWTDVGSVVPGTTRVTWTFDVDKEFWGRILTLASEESGGMNVLMARMLDTGFRLECGKHAG